MQRVQWRRGLRGALVHHFGSMGELLVCAVQHVAQGQLVELERAVIECRPGQDRRESVARLLHRFMSGPLFLAGLELWVAARTDPALREALVPAERELGVALRKVLGEALGGTNEALVERADLSLEALLALLRGLAITGVLRAESDLEQRVLMRWVEDDPGIR